MLLCVASGAQAQAMRAAVAADSVPLTIAAAERQGSQHRRVLPSEVVQRLPVGTLAPNGLRRCVQVSGNTAASGEFVAGGFASYPARWRRGAPKLWWAPAAIPQGATSGTTYPLRVAAVRLGPNPAAFVLHREHLAATIPDGLLFFPSEVTLASGGRWMLVVSAGGNWGCFLHQLA